MVVNHLVSANYKEYSRYDQEVLIHAFAASYKPIYLYGQPGDDINITSIIISPELNYLSVK